MSLQMSPVTKKQWAKVEKAVYYAFVSSFLVAWSAAGYNPSKSVLLAAATAGVNGVAVAIKQLFTEAENVN